MDLRVWPPFEPQVLMEEQQANQCPAKARRRLTGQIGQQASQRHLSCVIIPDTKYEMTFAISDRTRPL